MRAFIAACLMLVLSGMAAASEGVIYVSSHGDEYRYATNADGAVLTSLYPKAWFIEKGANSRIERGIDRLYLGKSCDAFHPVFGDGRWWWANGGFGVDFARFELRFPRQEIADDFGLHCRN